MRGWGRMRRWAGAVTALGLAMAAHAAVAEQAPSAEDILGAVVRLTAATAEDARTAGSLGTRRAGNGIVIDGDGLVLTIGYLILEATSATVTDHDGRAVPADVLAYDHGSGLGLVRAREPLGITPLALGSAAGLGRADRVLMVTREEAESATPTPARIADRRAFAGSWEYLIEDAIFTVPPRPWFGGAALVDARGRLVGVGSLVVGDAMRAPRRMAGNMFVPIDALGPVFADLLSDGRSLAPQPPWLGVYTEEFRGRLVVIRVAEDGPGAAAGVREGDLVLGVEGVPVTSLAEFYRTVWALGPAGTEVVLDLVRDGAVKRIRLRSGDRYDWLRITPPP